MLWDCAIIGGGPAGLNAALVLGRARRQVLLADDGRPRNAVTHESHGFLTRDGVKPAEFRQMAYQEIGKYPSVRTVRDRVTAVRPDGGAFELDTGEGVIYQARKLILATGLRERLPSVEGMTSFYGKSLFNCPYCDGWELRDRALVVISENEHAFAMARTVHQWSRDLVLATNGAQVLTDGQREALRRNGIRIMEGRIAALAGEGGMLQKVVFADGSEVRREGGFVTPEWSHSAPFGEALGCASNELGGIVTDGFGRTSVKGVYAAGDSAVIAPSQLIIAAAGGSRAAIGVNTDLTQEDFGAV